MMFNLGEIHESYQFGWANVINVKPKQYIGGMNYGDNYGPYEMKVSAK